MSAPLESWFTSLRWTGAAELEAMRTITLAVLLAMTSLLGGAAAAAQPPPEVEATFVFDPNSVFVTTKLTPSQQAEVKDQVSRRVVELCTVHFGFLRWRPAGHSGSTPSARLTITLRDLSKQKMPDNVLEFSGRIKNREIPLPQLGRIVVYQWFDYLPSNPDELGKRLAKKLDDLFTNEAFRREIHSRFLAGIPLAEGVVAHESEKRIIVPLSWDELKLGSRTVLLVKFIASPKRVGEMHLSLLKKRLRQPKPGSLQGAIKLFDCAPLTLSTLGAWDPKITLLLADAKEVRVFMESFVSDAAPDASDGLVTSPD